MFYFCAFYRYNTAVFQRILSILKPVTAPKPSHKTTVKSTMEQKSNEVCDGMICNNTGMFWPCLTWSASVQCPTNTSPQKHMKSRSKSIDGMQQSKKARSSFTYVMVFIIPNMIEYKVTNMRHFPGLLFSKISPGQTRAGQSEGEMWALTEKSTVCLNLFFLPTVCCSGVSWWLRLFYTRYKGTKVINGRIVLQHTKEYRKTHEHHKKVE